jgi:hypothetical protein
LNGHIVNTDQMDLLPETIWMLNTLASSMPSAPNAAVKIPDEFVSTYSLVKEDTSSGRHIGHYKVNIWDSSLVELHATMMSLPFQISFPPNRWCRIMDIMLEKEAGNSRCHRL